MSKTFKCVEHEEEVLEVYPFTGEEAGRKFSLLMPHVSSHAGIAFDSTTAPALALAILEAAGFDGDENMFTGLAVANLRDHVEEQERITAEAEAQAKLEAEALKLLNASLASCDLGQIELFDALNPIEQQRWLAVARKAREMRAEK